MKLLCVALLLCCCCSNITYAQHLLRCESTTCDSSYAEGYNVRTMHNDTARVSVSARNTGSYLAVTLTIQNLGHDRLDVLPETFYVAEIKETREKALPYISPERMERKVSGELLGQMGSMRLGRVWPNDLSRHRRPRPATLTSMDRTEVLPPALITVQAPQQRMYPTTKPRQMHGPTLLLAMRRCRPQKPNWNQECCVILRLVQTKQSTELHTSSEDPRRGAS